MRKLKFGLVACKQNNMHEHMVVKSSTADMTIEASDPEVAGAKEKGQRS